MSLRPFPHDVLGPSRASVSQQVSQDTILLNGMQANELGRDASFHEKSLEYFNRISLNKCQEQLALKLVTIDLNLALNPTPVPLLETLKVCRSTENLADQ